MCFDKHPPRDTKLRKGKGGLIRLRNHFWTVRERIIIALMNELTDTPAWERKVFDSDSTFKWKSARIMSGKA